METEKIRFQADSNCTSIIYTLDPDESISVFSNGMLTNNDIRGLSSYTYEENSGNRILSYSVSRGIALSTIKKQSLKKNVILTILKKITEILITVEEYMLDVDNVLLDDDFIFIDSAAFEPTLLFIPTNKPYRKPVRAFIKNCILSGVFDESEDANYIMKINNFLNSNEKATVKEICVFLDEMLGQTSGAAAVPNNAPNSAAVNSAPAQSVVQSAPRQEYNAAPAAKKPQQPQAKSTAPSGGDNSGKKKGFGGLFGKKEKNAPASASGSFAGMSIPGASPASPAPAASKAAPAKAPKNAKSANTPAPMPVPQNNQPVSAPAAQPAPVYAGAASSGGSFESEKTVFLGQDNSGKSLRAFLVSKNGTMNEINTDCFFIGKGINSGIPNNLVVQNNSVSRNHAVIEHVDNGYYIKDNNSLNGTFVNGQQIAPNIRTMLNNGDKVMLANEEFTFTLR